MLQALKLDSKASPTASQGRETGSDLRRQAFAGYLSAATRNAVPGLQMTAPCPVTPKEGEPRSASPRTEATLERPASRSTETHTARAKPDEDVEDPPQETPGKVSDQAELQASQQAQKPEQPPPVRENPRHEADQEKPPADSGQTETLTTNPAAQAPEPVAAATPPSAAAAPTEPGPSASTPIEALGKTAQAGEAQPAASSGQVPLQGSLPGTLEAMDPLQIVASKAQQDLEQTAGGSHLHTQIVEEAPNAASKSALSELLSVPKPAMEIPKPLLSAGKASEGTGKELPAAQLPATDKPLDRPIPQLTALATPASLVSEALQAALPRTETSAEKPSAPSNPSIAAGGTAAPVKGTTPVPALEGSQGAKANATFEQVDGSIRWIIKNQQKGAEIQLNPDSLGRVVIKLRMEGGEVHAKVWASEASTVPILQDQKSALAASLQQQGLSLGSFDLQQGRGGGDAHFQAQAQTSGSGAGIALSQEKKQDLPTQAPALPGGAHLIEVLA